MRKKFPLQVWLLTAMMLIGAGSAWSKTKVGETTNTLYEKTTWAESDLSDWTGSGGSVSIDGGLKVSSSNAGWAYTKSLNVSEDAVVTVNATLTAGGASGRNGSYDYITVGGITFGFKEQDRKAMVVVDGTSTDLTTTYSRNASHTISVEINTLSGDISYTVDGVEGTASSTTAVNSAVFGHFKNGSESYGINPVLNALTVTEVAPVYSSVNEVKTWDFTTVSLSTSTDGWTATSTAQNTWKRDFTNSTTSVSGLADLVFNGTWRIENNKDIWMFPGSSVQIPVTSGQTLTVVGTSNTGGGISVANGDITTITPDNYAFTAYIIAQSDGYITLTNNNGSGKYFYFTSFEIENAPDVYFSPTICTAELIDLNIVEPTLNYPEGASVTYSVSNTKIAKLGGEAHSGDLMALNTGVTTVTATVEYKGSTYTASYTLTISADEAVTVTNENTYTVVGPGKLGERVVNSVPKITVEMGENLDDVTNISIVRDEEGIGTVITTLDSNGWQQMWYTGDDKLVQPYQGTFYTFKPTANGKLTVKGYLRGANSVYLVDADNLAPMPSDLAGLVGKTGVSWNGTGIAPTWAAPAVNGYQMAEKYEGTVGTTGDILYQTVSNLPNGNYTVVLAANACFTEGRGITGSDGNEWVWNSNDANNIANVFVDNGTARQTQTMTALNAGSVNQNGTYTFNVNVVNGTLTIGMNKTAEGTNWHTIQIESLTYNDALQNYNFTPVWSYTPGGDFTNNQEVDVEAILEAGKTYYLYANIPSSNGVNAWGTYQLQEFTYESAWHFADRSVVVDFDDVTNYEGMAIETAIEGLNPNLTYTAIFKGNITGTINASTGKITSIAAADGVDDDDKGGAIVVTATDGTDSDLYVITVPYKNHEWDFWGLSGTREYPSDLKEEDFDWGMNYEVREYDTSTRNLYYLNEPILTAAQAVHGDNAAFIGETAGIVVEANAKTFGLRANTINLGDYDNFKAYFLDGGANQAKYADYIETYGLDSDEFTADKFEELKADGAFVDVYLKVMLRYTRDDIVISDDQPKGTNIAAMTVGSTLTIPHVKAGSHIAIKWYRHAPNDGDHIMLTNAVDLNDVAIENGVYVVNQGRGNNIFSNPYGWLEFKAAGNEGEYVDVTLTCEKGWTHIKAIAISEDFYDTNLAIVNDGSNSARKTEYDTTDGTDSNTFATTAYYTRSENGVQYEYTLEDITGTIDGNYTISGGTITFNQGTQGTATLVLTAFSNGYAIDREWLPIRVGAVGDTHQDYPYTWNFTNIDTDNLDGTDYWTKDGDDYSVNETGTTSHLQDNELKTSASDEDGVTEFDELGIETPQKEDGTPTGIDLTITDNGDGTTTTTVGDEGITFVVPDVPADATVYVKVVTDDNSTVNVSNGDDSTTPSITTLDDGTTVYSIDGNDDDVKVELKNTEIKGIAVTNIFKEARMASASEPGKYYNTDCQAKDIDYSLTDYYTGYEMNAMFIKAEGIGNFDYTRETATVEAEPVEAPVAANTGLIVYTSDNETLHPLFVPDVNTTARQTTTGNMLVGVLFDEETENVSVSTETLKKYVQQADGSTTTVDTEVTVYTGDVTPAEGETYRYLFTNQYNMVGKDVVIDADEPAFYRLKANGGKLKSNRAYLVIDQSVLTGVNSIKAIYLHGLFNDDELDEPTAIELVEDANIGIDVNGTFYTLSGMKIQGLPTKSGIYIQNGKKIMVK